MDSSPPPPAHPFLPLHNFNQHPPRHARLRGAALIGPPSYPRQRYTTPFDRELVGAQRPVNVIVIFRDVQGIVAENYPALQIRPRARSSASIRSGGASPGTDRSGGASVDARYRQPWNGRHTRGRVG